MPSLNQFKIKIMREHSAVMLTLLKIPDSLLGTITYIDNSRVLAYVEEIQRIINSIDKDYKDKINQI